MLTPAQQKVKQELDELKAAGACHHSEERVPSSSEVLYSKGRIYLAFGLVIFLLAVSIVVIKISIPSKSKISSYLAKEEQYNQKSLILFNDYIGKNDSELEAAVDEQAELVKNAGALSVPSEIEEHNRDFMDVMEQRLDILKYMFVNKQDDASQLNKLLIELDVKQELAKESLLKALNREKIQYEEHIDGTVQYWIEGKS
ncbi:hypothetical protein [Neobacillus mesonae]|uniref:hypothetical protein n=1 Tax=Neobacillus mesonae TaxID=1193713 RepID=UPI0008352FF1|nr:hypothetical protein [Neobacillus mesonae]